MVSVMTENDLKKPQVISDWLLIRSAPILVMAAWMVLAFCSALQKSATSDEPAHFGSGLSASGASRTYRVKRCETTGSAMSPSLILITIRETNEGQVNDPRSRAWLPEA